ncbi:hypothetical protein PQX77_017689 [Marasmius sp. AFHP31]|nr:hypothetical protein PQX77_017689 [Marasmius sp. AFHP31]
MPPARRQQPRRKVRDNVPAPRDPSEAELETYYRNLRRHIRQGRMVTFDPHRKQWRNWPRPYAEHADGTISNLHAYQFGSATASFPVLCPHSSNTLRTRAECTMVVHTSPERGDYFRIHNSRHYCDFQIPIPALATLPEMDEYPAMDDWPFSEETRTLSPPPAEQGNRTSDSTSRVSPHLSPLPWEVEPDFHVFFTHEKALQRAEHNPQFIEKVRSAHLTGDYANSHLLSHPAHSSPTHHLLQEWDLDVRPNGQNLVNQHQQFVATGVGFATRNLFSTLGVPDEVWNRVVASAITCSVCHCVYSADGYSDHINEHGYCRNWYEAKYPKTPIRYKVNVTPESVWSASHLADDGEGWWDKKSASRAALLQWNSRIGVSQNVWAVISTMEVFCPACSRMLGAFWALMMHSMSAMSSFNLNNEIITLADPDDGRAAALKDLAEIRATRRRHQLNAWFGRYRCPLCGRRYGSAQGVAYHLLRAKACCPDFGKLKSEVPPEVKEWLSANDWQKLQTKIRRFKCNSV